MFAVRNDDPTTPAAQCAAVQATSRGKSEGGATPPFQTGLDPAPDGAAQANGVAPPRPGIQEWCESGTAPIAVMPPCDINNSFERTWKVTMTEAAKTRASVCRPVVRRPHIAPR